jgi:hypothetical protein
MSDRLSKDRLSSELDGFFTILLEEARGSGNTTGEDGQPQIGFLDRLRLFSEGVRWAAVKAKVETEDTEDEFGKLRRGHIGSTGRSRAARAPARPNGGA